jgi:putative aldouronate transport system permease protein
MLIKDFKRFKLLYLMILPVLIYFAVFSYAPMYGLLMAFENYNVTKGIWGSDWVGVKHFVDFFSSPYFTRVIRNTLLLNLYGLIFVFPLPIIFALLINEFRSAIFKRVVQTISYLPYFISIVVITGIIKDFTSQTGLITYLVQHITGNQENMNLLTKESVFRPLYIISDMWQYTGFSAIIYFSALSSVNSDLYEASTIDGANRWKQMLHISLPGIAPTIIILFILQVGNIMSVGFDKVFLLQNPAIYSTSDVIATYVYRQGLVLGQISYSTAVGLFNTIINFIILIVANQISRKFSETSLY